MSDPGLDDGAIVRRKIGVYRDVAFLVLITVVIVAYVVSFSGRLNEIMRHSRDVVNWHGIEVRNQDAHRERLERRFDAVEALVKENHQMLEKLLREHTP